MKRQLKISAAGVAMAIILFATSNAQDASAGLSLFSSETVYNETALINTDLASGNSPVSATRASKDFSDRFKNAGNATWYDLKSGMIVKFEQNGKSFKACYDKNGRWYYTITVYGENKLPADVRKAVKSVYYDYSIIVVIEVNIDNKTAYLVKMEDEKTLKTIRVVDGEMDVYEDFQKAY